MESNNALLNLVQSNKISSDKIYSLLDSLSSHQLTIEEFQVLPDELLVEYLRQTHLQLSLVEQMHIIAYIKMPIRMKLFI